ncbi:MAG: outer membrane lipoprotein-sorting protein [Pseudomonadota bacterium]
MRIGLQSAFRDNLTPMVVLLLTASVLAQHAPFARSATNSTEQTRVVDGTDAELTAEAIVNRVNNNLAVDQLSRTILFRALDKRGKVRERKAVSLRRDFGDERRLILYFTSPSSIRDTAVLTLDKPRDVADDQWLYLPALRKVRRIPSAERGDKFLGTEFSFEDMKLDGGLSLKDCRYTLVETTADGAYVLRAEPLDDATAGELGYSRALISVDPINWVVTEGVFWDPAGQKSKTLTVDDVRNIDGRSTRHFVRMDNHLTGSATELVITDVDYRSTIDERMFTTRALKRGY